MSEKDIKKRNPAEEEEEEGGGQGGSQAGQFDPLHEDPAAFGQIESDEEGEGGTGTGGGAAGEIKFRYKDPYSVSPRDEQLPSEEIKRLLTIHKDQHKGQVDKQKQTRKERAALKEGKVLYNKQQNQGRGFGPGGRMSNYKSHPIALKAQFSGIDKQVSNLPNENEAKTNPELQNRLENRNELRLGQRQTFNPKPRPS